MAKPPTASNNLRPRNPLFDTDAFSEQLRATERQAKLIRPLRITYQHLICGMLTKLNYNQAVLLARHPKDYSVARCDHCNVVTKKSEFVWDGTNDIVGM